MALLPIPFITEDIFEALFVASFIDSFIFLTLPITLFIPRANPLALRFIFRTIELLFCKTIHLPMPSTLRTRHHLPFWHLQGKIFFQFPVLQAPFRAIFLFADNDVSYRVHHLPLSVFYFFNKFYTIDISRKFHTLHRDRCDFARIEEFFNNFFGICTTVCVLKFL